MQSIMLSDSSDVGYKGYKANVQAVTDCSTSYLLSVTGIPSYTIGPWNSPNVAVEIDRVVSIPKNPTEATNHLAVPDGDAGYFVNGVAMFSTSDAMSYNDDGVWN